MTMQVRCSALDRAMECSGSLIAPALPVNYPSPVASTGSAGHLAMQRIIADGVDPDTAVDGVCAEDSSVDRSDVGFLVSEAMRAWRAISGNSFAAAQTEVPLTSRLTRGTADVVRIGDGEALVVDWKMGYGTDRHDAQLTGYAAGVVELMREWPASGYVRTVEVHVRHGQWYERHITPQRLADFEQELQRRIEAPQKQWAPGRACTFCESRHECAARTVWVRSSIALLRESMDLGPSREMVAELYSRAEALSSVLQDYWGVVGTMLDDGPLTLPDGRVAQWAETKREEINLAKGWSTLRQMGLDIADILGATRVSKTALRRAIEDAAPRGEKAKRSAAVFDALREAHAVQRNVIQRRDVRRPKE